MNLSFFILSLIGVAGLAGTILNYWIRFAELIGAEQPIRRWFLRWTCKGILIPIIIWFIFNAGIGFPPIMPEIEAAKSSGGDWVAELMKVMGGGVWMIGSYWGAVTMGWLLGCIFMRVDRRDFLTCCGTWSLVLVPLGLVLFSWASWKGAGFAVMLLLFPTVYFTLPLLTLEKHAPIYSGAVAKMQFGKYEEAELEVIEQLESCEEDFDGWMLLADLYATQYHDLTVAEKTVMELCGQPNLNPSQISVALNRLADWHLKLADDPVAARRILNQIAQRFPNTHLAKMAQQRANQLPSSKEELLAQRKGRPIHLPAIKARFGENADEIKPEVNLKEAAALANRCVEKLKLDPNHVESREELARIFAEKLDQPEHAFTQIKLLLGMSDQPVRKRAEWLGLLAAWHLRSGDKDRARIFLEQIVRNYPQSPQAFAAQCRLNLMDIESKAEKARHSEPKAPSLD